MKRKNCECCGANYDDNQDKWYEWPFHKDGMAVYEGLCQFCDSKNKKWYIDHSIFGVKQKNGDLHSFTKEMINKKLAENNLK